MIARKEISLLIWYGPTDPVKDAIHVSCQLLRIQLVATTSLRVLGNIRSTPESSFRLDGLLAISNTPAQGKLLQQRSFPNFAEQ